MKKVTAVLLGAGARGTIYARYALEKPKEFEIVAVAEPDAERRRAFARTFGVPEEKQFGDCMELLAQGTLADAALICTMDQMHTAPALKAIMYCWKSRWRQRKKSAVQLPGLHNSRAKCCQFAMCYATLRFTAPSKLMLTAKNSGKSLRRLKRKM